MPWQPTQIALVDESQGLAEADVYLVNASRRDVTFTLPDPRQTEGRRIVVKKTDLSSNAVRIAVLAGTTVDGAIQYVLTTPQESVHLESDGRAYYVLKSHRPGAGGGGGGEANTASNVGTGHGVFQTKVGVDLRFRSLKAGPNITLNPSGDEIEIAGAAGGGEANTSSNVGAGHGLALPKVGVNLPFKSLKAGPNILLTPSGTEIEIAAPGGGASPQTHSHVDHEVPAGSGSSFTLAGTPMLNTVDLVRNGLRMRQVVTPTGANEYSISGSAITLGVVMAGGEQLWAHYDVAAGSTHAHVDKEVPTGSGTTRTLAAIPLAVSEVVIVNGFEYRRVAGVPVGNEYSISGATLTFAYSVDGMQVWVDYRI